MLAGRLGDECRIAEVAHSARRLPAASVPRASDLLLDGLTLLIVEGRDAAVPVLRKAVSAFTTAELAPEEELYWLWLAATAPGCCGTTRHGDCWPRGCCDPARNEEHSAFSRWPQPHARDCTC